MLIALYPARSSGNPRGARLAISFSGDVSTAEASIASVAYVGYAGLIDTVRVEEKLSDDTASVSLPPPQAASDDASINSVDRVKGLMRIAPFSCRKFELA
jgi:hypothetical protein